jgi:flavocytochrome c
MKKMWLALFAVMIMVLGCASRPSAYQFIPGTYIGEGFGYAGRMVMAVEVDSSRIISIAVREHSETVAIAAPAFDRIPRQIIERQSLVVDNVAGATLTANGIITGVRYALISAGATEDQLMARAPRRAGARAREIRMETDVLVVGAGGAGYSAALEALQAGARVIVIDKLATIGGNTRVAGSAMNAANPELQRRLQMSPSEFNIIQGILAMPAHDDHMRRWQENVRRDLAGHTARGAAYLFDSPDLHKLQTYIGGDFIANPELVELLGDYALESVNWLASLGGGWTENISAAVGATWARSHLPNFNFGSAGSNFVLPQEKRFTQLGGETFTEFRAERILMERGRAVGVSGRNSAGTPFTIRANRGVVLATGGFSANVEMRERHNRFWPTLDATIRTSNIATANGDGILMAEAIGANIIDMEWIQLVTRVLGGSFSASISNNIFVNRDGDRFIREDGRRDDLSMASLSQPGSFFWWISDGHTVDDMLGGVDIRGRIIRDRVDNYRIFMAYTIEDLAIQKGADPVRFRRAVDDFNAAVAGAPDVFGRQVFESKINKPPFFAAWSSAEVHHTMGGVEINVYCQVLDTSGRVIPGLYAAGEVVGGIHGSNRLGANAITDIIVFGRIAGQSAAASR